MIRSPFMPTLFVGAQPSRSPLSMRKSARFGRAEDSQVQNSGVEPWSDSASGLNSTRGQALGLLANNSTPSPVQHFVTANGYPLTVYTLSNGHRLMVEQRPSDNIGVRTFVNAGSVIEDAIKPSPLYQNSGIPSGLAHLDEHLHLTSSQNHPNKNGMAEALEQMGSHSNASTSDERIQHELFFNREDLPQALRLHAESLLRPLLNPDEINQEKINVWNENAYRMGEVPYKLEDRFSDLMFERPEQQTIGTLQTLQNTTPEDIRRFREKVYTPGNMLTIVTGNVNPQQVYNILAPEFLSNQAIKRSGGNETLQLALRPNEVRVATVTDPRISTGVVHLGFPAPPVNNYRDRMAMEFLTHILAGNSLSRLDQALVNQKGLASNVSVRYQPFRQTGVCKFMLDTPVGKEREAASEVLNQVAKIAQGEISDDQVAKTRQALVQQFRSRLDMTEMASRWMGGEGLSNTLPYALHYEQIANLITAQDLQEVAQKYLDPKRYVLVYGLPALSSSASSQEVSHE